MWKAVAKPFMNIEKIHPHQQEAVGKMVELCKQHDKNDGSYLLNSQLEWLTIAKKRK